jgi:ATP phosphoribosyltransferase regulatory subunit
MPITIGTPAGTGDRLFAECSAYRTVQKAVTGLFRSRGYAELMTPEVEFYDLFAASGNPLPQQSMLKLIDRSSRILVMRPDNTTPIARVAATKLRTAAMPQRMYYNQTVFRSDDAHTGTQGEIPQCGVELIGAAGIRADLEIIAMAVQALEATGLTEFQLELGHAGFFTALVADTGADAQTAEALRQAVENRNFALFSDLLAPYLASPAGKALHRISRLFGGVEVLAEARALSDAPQAVAALDYLNELYEELRLAGLSGHVRFDLSLVQGIDYYTGVVFRGYAQGAGKTVLSGGRYDGLIGRFGHDVPATGFAVDIAALASCFEQQEPIPPQTVIWYGRGCLGRALQVIAEAPKGSCVLSAAPDEAQAAQEARAHGAQTLLVLEQEGERSVAL